MKDVIYYIVRAYSEGLFSIIFSPHQSSFSRYTREEKLPNSFTKIIQFYHRWPRIVIILSDFTFLL